MSKKKMFGVVLTAALMLTVSACGANGGQTDGNTQIANPWSDITEAQAGERIAKLFHAPDGATNAQWSAMEDGENGTLVQLTFDLDGMSFTERAQKTNEETADISGLFYDWTVSDDVTFTNWGDGTWHGKTYRYIGDTESVDLITWYDTEAGISYSLSTSASDLEGFDIQAVAEASFAG